MTSVGSVSALWRYPVKSMLGKQCETVELNERGIEGDRVYAVRDAGGKLGSGKNTGRFRKIDGLFGFRAGYRGRVPEITLPGGLTVRADDSGVHAVLSAALGQPVTLARESAVPHFDDGAVHLLTTASLAWLRAGLPEARVDERRFRANLLLDVPGNSTLEQRWTGRRLRVGPHAELRIVGPTERCGMVTFAQNELPDDPRILHHLADFADLAFGVYAQVLAPGTIHRGDPVLLIG